MLVKRGRGVGATVQTAELDALSVTAAKLAADAVETIKILNDAVTSAKIAADTIVAADIAPDAVDYSELKIANKAASKFVRINATNDGFEATVGGASAADNITINGQTLTLAEWLLV